MQEEGGGFDVIFKSGEEPENITCSICLLTLREPTQAVPCGHRYCLYCINEWKKEKGTDVKLLCPIDRIDIETFADKGKEREILDLLVKCKHREQGCTWSKELRMFDQHLRDECNFESLACLNKGCNEKLLRQKMVVHLQHGCKYRIITCSYCSMFYPLIKEKLHEDSCALHPLVCFNNCGRTEIPRSKMTQHLDEDCPKTIKSCSFKTMGCTITGTMDDLKNHCQSESLVHLSMARQRIGALEETLEKRDCQIKTVNNQYDIKLAMLSNQMQSLEHQLGAALRQMNKLEIVNKEMAGNSYAVANHALSNENKITRLQMLQDGISVIDWEIKNFAQSARLPEIISTPFYSHPKGGYKMRLEATLNGKEKMRYLSLYVRILKGEFDEILEWPIKANIRFSILNFNNDEVYERISNTASVRDSAISIALSQPAGEDNDGWGYAKYIMLHDIFQNNYVINNSLTFVFKIQLINQYVKIH